MKKYFLLGMFGGLISSICFLLIVSFKEYSSIIADWLSALGTISAVLFSLWVVLKEEKLDISPYLHIPFPPSHVDEYLKKLSEESGLIAATNDGFTLLCIANKMKSNVQVRVEMIRVIDVMTMEEVRNVKGVVVIPHGTEYYETGYIVLPSGEICQLAMIDTNYFVEENVNYEIEVMLDFIDKGRMTIIIKPLGGGLSIVPMNREFVGLG